MSEVFFSGSRASRRDALSPARATSLSAADKASSMPQPPPSANKQARARTLARSTPTHPLCGKGRGREGADDMPGMICANSAGLCKQVLKQHACVCVCGHGTRPKNVKGTLKHFPTTNVQGRLAAPGFFFFFATGKPTCGCAGERKPVIPDGNYVCLRVRANAPLTLKC